MVFLTTALWLVAWGFVGASIVIATTSGAPAGVVDLAVQSVGNFYLTAVATLRQFALSTTVSPRWVDVGYAVLAIVPVFVHFFVLATAIKWSKSTPEEGNGPENLLLTGVAGGIVALIGASVFNLGAQLLTLSIVGVGVVSVPFGYALLRAIIT